MSFEIDVVTLAVVTIGFVVWLARLEGKVRYQEKQIDSLTVRHEALDSQLVQKLTRLESAIARIEGYLQAKNEET